MKNKITITLLLVVFTASLNGQTTLFDYGSTWKYYDNANEPAAQGADSWKDPGYDHTNWASGPAHLGYGDNDEATVVNSSAITVYFRASFSIIDPSFFETLDIDLTYDDGAVVYLNGVEVWRVNMPTGPISYGTFTPTQSTDNAAASISIANALIPGINVISVEVHQRSASSSDISFDFRMRGLTPGQVVVERGPYLQKSSPNLMTIKWRTSTATSSMILYGPQVDSLTEAAIDFMDKTEHDLQLTGLSPDTRYYYAVADTNGIIIPPSSDLYFQTPPAVGSTQPITAWVLGDCGTANNDQRAVRDAYYNYIGSNHTDMILFLGDNAYNDGTDNEYQTAIFENMYEGKLQNTVAWSCLGNHDGHSANSNSQTGPYYDIFSFPTAGESGGVASGTEAYYSFDYGNVHFISLDSYESDRGVGGAMFNWCQADIQNTTADWIVAFWHHPPYSKGSHNSDTETQLVEMRENFLPMLEDNGVDLVLSGHSHSYERSYFLNGHYGNSGTFNTVTHTVGANGAGNGQIGGDGAYNKTSSGSSLGDGAVYITAGSSGKITNAALDHNAMYYSVASLGSCIIEVEGDQMDVKFIRETGNIEDYFTIQKSPVCTAGNACDDGNVCTTGDVYDSSCVCAGVYQDSDNDGICDATDQCPGFDDGLLGTSCDDGDNCTLNDIYTENCECAGTYTDTDADGLCDGNDDCPDLNNDLIGMPCDDENACTTGDMYGMDCQCHGTIQDADNDGVCDAEDQCPGFDDTLIGTSCDDGDVCTEGDIYTVNCACAGTFIDSDQDGICNANDQCPELDNALIGTSCDDGDPCTEDDFYNSNCNCAGTYNDTDNDGVCNAQDQCPGFNNNLIGTSCDDGDDCTTNDVYTENCNCAGTLIDSDQDGICDTLDDCPNLHNDLIGTACNDEDICTINDVYTENCECAGTYSDSDNDGICDAEDQCPNFNDDLIGTNCDDADPCTISDTYDQNCNCEGIYIDNDEDGYCVGEDPNDHDPCVPDTNAGACDPCSVFMSDSFENGFGNWNDGGRDCARVTGSASSGSFSIRIRDNSGTSSSMFTDILDLSIYESIKIEFSFLPLSMENNEDFFLEISSNGGASYSLIAEWNRGVEFENGIRYFESVDVIRAFTNNTRIRFRCDASGNNDQIYIDDIVIYGCAVSCIAGQPCNDGSDCTTDDVYDLGCNCVGTLIDSDNDGVCDAEDQCPDFNDQLIGSPCDDGDVCTEEDIYATNCNCTGVYQDSDNDGTCDALDQCPDLNDDLIGSPCNDGNACTENDTFNANCGCEGTFVDSDNDGVCDAEDLCPGLSDGLIGTSCDDNDACTVDDIFTEECICAGTYQDFDGDGLCVGVDPDDQDGCNPNPDAPVCGTCPEIDNESFEANLGIWNDGGSDCALVTTNANTGDFSMRLRDNSGVKSSMYTDPIDLSNTSEVNFSFSFIPIGLENNEDFFFEISTNGGSSYSLYQEWNLGVEIANNIRYNELIDLSGFSFTDNTVFRLRCDASNNGDQVFIDDVIITGCQNPGAAIISEKESRKSLSNLSLNVFPNPATDILNIEIYNSENTNSRLVIYNLRGQEIHSENITFGKNDHLKLNIENWEPGIYLTSLFTDGVQVKSQKVIILR